MESIVSNYLLTPACYQQLFVEQQLTAECLSLAVSRLLSYAILAGSLFLRVPQIAAILAARSAKGVSPEFYYFDTLSVTIAAAVGFRHAQPFSTFGESYFLLAGDLFILAQIFFFQRRPAALLAVLAVFAVGAFLLFSSLLPVALLDALSVLVPIPAMILSRGPQIYQLWKDKSPGSLSFLMFFVNTAGSLARVFTTLREVASWTVLAGFLVSSVCNGTIAAQLFYYTFVAKNKAKPA